VWCGACLGLIISFLLGRYLLRSCVEERISQYPKWIAVDRAIRAEGWKITLLLRLAPIFPFNFLNYLLALTSIPVCLRCFRLRCHSLMCHAYVLIVAQSLYLDVMRRYPARHLPVCVYRQSFKKCRVTEHVTRPRRADCSVRCEWCAANRCGGTSDGHRTSRHKPSDGAPRNRGFGLTNPCRLWLYCSERASDSVLKNDRNFLDFDIFSSLSLGISFKSTCFLACDANKRCVSWSQQIRFAHTLVCV
jgi:hypothetical protein